MTEAQNEKKYDLEERTFKFAKRVIEFITRIEKNLSNVEIAKQLIRSSGSVGANYIEANEAFSKKDFVLRIKICRKEAKESCYWLKLITCGRDTEQERSALLQESTELMKIFGSIVTKSQ
jgi:four helix bundle protein